MGLGKTLQVIALFWTLLRQSPFGTEPFLKKVVVVAPVSLVKNWQLETNTWLAGKNLYVLAVNSEDADVKGTFFKYAKDHYRVLITSYESLVAHGESLKGTAIDLLVCDEGHRLKNVNTKQYRQLAALHSRKRILITGTPIQNNLMELFACASFVIPDLFKTEKSFRKIFADPIEKGLAKGAFARDVELSRVRSKELADMLAGFMIRRTQKILEQFLPPRHEFHVYLRPTDLQLAMYNRCIGLRNARPADSGSLGDLFTLSTILRKLLTLPALIHSAEEGCCEDMKKYVAACREAAAGFAAPQPDQPQLCSSKFAFLGQLLEGTSRESKLIVVSYFTTSLDAVGAWLDLRDIKFCRLDGSMSAKERQKQLARFKSPTDGFDVFLLGAKAGGVGLNIVAANRMVLLDLDWNPSNDAQVMGRVYRKGQTRPVYIYRLIAAGTVEEKVLERQFSKQDLSDAVETADSADFCQRFTPEELRALFKPCSAAVGKHVLKKPNSAKFMLSKDPHLQKVADLIRYVVASNSEEDAPAAQDMDDSDAEDKPASEADNRSSPPAKPSPRLRLSRAVAGECSEPSETAEGPSVGQEQGKEGGCGLAEGAGVSVSKTALSKRSSAGSESEGVLELFKQCLE